MLRKISILLCFAILFFIAGKTMAVDPNLRAQFNFEGNLKNEGSVGGAGIVNGPGTLFYSYGAKGGQAADPNGSQYIDCNAPILDPNNNRISVAAWIKSTVDDYVGDANWKTIVGNGKNWSLETGSGRCHFMVGTVEVKSPPAWASSLNKRVVNNKWQHIVGVYDKFAGTKGKISLYINSVEVNSIDANNLPAKQSGNVWIGQIYADPCRPGNHYFYGAIDDVQIYNRALIQSDVNAIYGFGPKDPNLLAQWKFNQNTANYAGGHFVEEVNKIPHTTYVSGPNSSNSVTTAGDPNKGPSLGKAIHFDGNSYLYDKTYVIPPNFDSTVAYYVKEITICNWVKNDAALTNGTANWLAIINNGGNWDISYGFNTTMLFWGPTPNQYSPNMPAPGFEDGKWHHLANVYNMNNFTGKIYWDGVLIGTKNLDSSFAGGASSTRFWIAGCTNYFQIGHPINDYDVIRRLRASLCDLRVYDKALGLSAIWSIINNQGGGDLPTEPNPDDGATGIAVNTSLTWKTGYSANYHHVYFGTSSSAVAAATTASPEYKAPPLARTNTVYTPSTLLRYQTYYWKINEANASGVEQWGQSPVWSFTTIPYAVYDDFETYTSQSLLILKWKKYSTSSTLVKTAAPNVHGGAVSMQVRVQPGNVPYQGGASKTYSTSGTYNMTTYDGNSPSQAMKALSLWFISKATVPLNANKVPIWIELKDNLNHTGRIYWGNGPTGDANASQITTWTQWEISLQDFTNKGVDITNITSLTFGEGTGTAIGSAGVNNDMWVDDIYLYVPICIPSKVAGDFTGDCIINAADLAVFAKDWLAFDANPTTLLRAFYDFEDGAPGGVTADSPDPNYLVLAPGTLIGTGVSIVTDPCGLRGKVAKFTGFLDGGTTDANITCGKTNPSKFDANAGATITAWIRTDVNNNPGEQTIAANSGSGPRLYLAGSSIQFAGGGRGTDYGDEVVSGGKIDPNKWHHVAGVYDPFNSFVTVYVDGNIPTKKVNDVNVPVTKYGVHGNAIATQSPFSIGGMTDRAWPFKGMIDDVGYYNRALTQAEIRAVMNGNKIVTTKVIYVPLLSPANLYDKEPIGSKWVNFRDYDVMALKWLQGPILWP